MDDNVLLLILLAVLVVVFIACQCLKQTITKKEPYGESFTATGYSTPSSTTPLPSPGWVVTPSFRADTAPRFDPNRTGGGQIKGSYPGLNFQAAPVEPITVAPNFSAMGGAYQSDEGKLSTDQVNKILVDKFSGNKEYLNTKDLMPAMSMKHTLSRDPSDPSVWMYDRTLYAPLKRRYGKTNVDFIRGDLKIKPLNTGWFDIRPPQSVDIVNGYFSSGFQDIEETTLLQDAEFKRNRSLNDQALDKALPWGNSQGADRKAFSHL